MTSVLGKYAIGQVSSVVKNLETAMDGYMTHGRHRSVEYLYKQRTTTALYLSWTSSKLQGTGGNCQV